jgi:hypothetical protein
VQCVPERRQRARALLEDGEDGLALVPGQREVGPVGVDCEADPHREVCLSGPLEPPREERDGSGREGDARDEHAGEMPTLPVVKPPRGTLGRVRRAVDPRADTVGRRLAMLAMLGLLAVGATACDGGGVDRSTGASADGAGTTVSNDDAVAG